MATAAVSAITGGGTVRPTALHINSRRNNSGLTRLVKLSSVSNTPDESKNILKPKQKKLTTVESQRVMTVAHQTKSKLEGTLILPLLYDHLDRFGVAMGTELVARIQEYHELCMEYNACYEKLSELEIEPNTLYTSRSNELMMPSPQLEPLNVTADNITNKFHQLQFQLRHSTKNLLRQLIQCPSFDVIMKELQNAYPMRASKLSAHMSNLCNIVEEMLLTTYNEETRRKEYLEIITEQYEHADKDIKILQCELEKAKTLCANEIEKRDRQKKKVINDMRTTDRLAKDIQQQIEQETTSQETANQKSHDSHVTVLQEELTVLKKSLEDTKSANKEIEIQLRKKSYKRETEADNWIQKYDTEIGELQNELESLETEFDEEKKQAKELQDRLEVLSVEYEIVVKEQEETRKKEQEEQERLTLMTQSAIVIQSCWRSYKTRKMLKKDVSKGKKSGKKSGKKGKKNKGSGKKTKK